MNKLTFAIFLTIFYYFSVVFAVEKPDRYNTLEGLPQTNQYQPEKSPEVPIKIGERRKLNKISNTAIYSYTIFRLIFVYCRLI